MSAAIAPQSDTGRRTRVRLMVTGRPTATDLVDAAFVLALGALALWGFRTSFDSPRFLAVGMIGLVLGIAVAHIANTLRRRWLVLALMVVVTFFLFGGAVALTSDAIGGVLPDGSVLGRLAQLTITGWKDLLTTLPPVDGTGQFLVLPYVLGLAFGSATFSWARRSEHPAWPAVLPVILLVLVLALGTLQPAGLLLQGLGFALLAFVWVALRRRRTRHVVGTGGGARSQAVIGAALLAAALGIGAIAGGTLPGVAPQRLVLRSYVQPPFDITQYPSPLVGYRKYTEGVKYVWDQELFVVTGLPTGSLMRIAVLDDYSGTVWSAAGASGGSGYNFRKVGQTIGVTEETAEPVRVTVRVGAAYAGINDVNSWVPSPGYPTSIVFSGPHAKELSESIRYNPLTGQGLATTRLAKDDEIAVTAVPVPTVGGSFATGTGPTLPSEVTQSVTAKAVKWADKSEPGWAQLEAIAAMMRNGAYSDGTRSGETQYLPGHGVARTTTFLARPQLVGNDEQYASTFALMANSLGIPARVVLGAVVPAGGSVQGQHMHAWVEVFGQDDRWYAVPSTTFVPDRSRTPQEQPQAVPLDANAADVPPPNSQRPPGSVDATFDTTSAVVRPPSLLDRLADAPAWVIMALKILGYPVLAFVTLAGVLALARGMRRRRRQRVGSASRRLAQGWRDYVDHARDLGMRVPAGLTRQEQARIVGEGALARRADDAVFGFGDPAPDAVAGYWSDVKAARRRLSKAARRRQRLARRLSARGLLARDQRPVEQLSQSMGTRGRSGMSRLSLPTIGRARA